MPRKLSFPTLMIGMTGLFMSLSGAPVFSEPPLRRVVELQKRIEADNRNNPVASVMWEKEGLEILAGIPDPGLESWFLRSLVRDQDTLGNFPEASATLERARRQVIQRRDERGRLLLEVEAGSMLTNWEKVGEARTLLGSLLPGLDSYWAVHPEDAEIAHALGRGYRILGLDQQNLGANLEAIHAYQKALQIAEKVNDPRGQVGVLDDMGNFYTRLGRFDEALVSHRQAAALALDLHDAGLQTICCLSLANTFGQKGEIGRQIEELGHAADLARSAQDHYLLLLAEMNLADAYLRKKDFPATLRYAESALRSPHIASYPKFIAVSRANRGIALNRLGRTAEGLAAIREALDHFKETKAVAETVEVTGNLAEEYAYSGDFRRAFGTEVELLALIQAVNQEQDKKHIAEASAAYEADKQRYLIDRLTMDQRRSARLRLMWVALGILGFSVSSLLIFNRRRLKQSNAALVDLNDRNTTLISQLQAALAEVRILQGLIPICAYCKKIRDDQGFWNQLEAFLQDRTEARFSHGICPECALHMRAGIQAETRSEGD